MEIVKFGSAKNPLEIDAMKLQCFILTDNSYIFETGSISESLGYDGTNKNWLPDFITHISRFISIPIDLIETLKAGVAFKYNENIDEVQHGITATELIEICEVIISAKDKGYLYLSELKYAKSAEKIREVFTNYDAAILIENATGYTMYKSKRKNALAENICISGSKSIGKWINTIPDDLFLNLLAFKNYNWENVTHNLNDAAILLYNILFERMSDKEFQILSTTKPKMSYRKQFKAEQYLPHPILVERFTAIKVLLALSDYDHDKFMELLEKTFPVNEKLSIFWNENKNQDNDPKLAYFKENLIKAITPRR